MKRRPVKGGADLLPGNPRHPIKTIEQRPVLRATKAACERLAFLKWADHSDIVTVNGQRKSHLNGRRGQ